MRVHARASSAVAQRLIFFDKSRDGVLTHGPFIVCMYVKYGLV